MAGLFTVLLFIPAVFSLPPPTPDQIGSFVFNVGQRDRTFGGRLRYEPRPSVGGREDHDFQYVYVGQDGTQFPSPGDRVDLLEVSATETVDTSTYDTALWIVYLQCRNMPRSLWLELCKNGAVGVFTMAEGTTIFPEYLIYRDTPECKGTCAGSCAITCTGDGRKYDSLAGLGGSRGTCVNDNIMCNEDDPYSGQTNILVHEFAHTIHGYALDKSKQNEIYYAWLEARAAATWDLSSYAMSTDYEYFAEAAGVFFHANNYLWANGGMSNCFGKGYCEDEADARAWLKFKDPSLYSLLSFTFTDYKPELEGELAQCVKI